MRTVEFANYLLRDEWDMDFFHPVFRTFFECPPDNYIFIRRPKEAILLKNKYDWIKNHSRISDVSEKILTYIDRLKGKSLDELSLSKIYRNLAFRCERSTRVPKEAELVFQFDVPNFVFPTKYVFEIEDAMMTLISAGNLLLNDFSNIDLTKVDFTNLESYIFSKILLEEEYCTKIISHSPTTANKIGDFFESDIIKNKSVYVPPTLLHAKGDIEKDFRKDKFVMLFTNSWAQGLTNFYFRGGLEILESFKVLLKKYPFVELIIRSELPKSLSEENVRFIEDCPNIKLLNDFVSELGMDNLFEQADLILLPSQHLHVHTLLRGFSTKSVVLGSDGWGFSDFIRHGENGVIVHGRGGKTCFHCPEKGVAKNNQFAYIRGKELNEKIVENLITEISNLIDTPEKRRTISENAYKEYWEKYSLDDRNKILKDVLDEVWEGTEE